MNPKSITAIVGGIIAGIVALTVFFGSWYTVDQGERAVILTNGKISGVADPGMHFKFPLVQRTVDIGVRTESRLYDNMASYSKDQQTAILRVSVNARVDTAYVAKVYENYGSLDGLITRVLDRRVYEQSKVVFGQYTALDAIQQRARLNDEITSAIAQAVAGTGLVVEGVQLENIDFSDGYEAAVEAAARAKADVERAKSELARVEQEAQQKVKHAQAQAEATKAAADAEAHAIRVKGEAEAAAIDARGKALRDNPSLVSLTAAERWNGVLPTTMVPNGAVPFVPVK